MKTLLEREADIIKFGDTIELKKLLPDLSDDQLLRFAKRLCGVPLWTLREMVCEEMQRREKT
jgi:hypothetical protein